MTERRNLFSMLKRSAGHEATESRRIGMVGLLDLPIQYSRGTRNIGVTHYSPVCRQGSHRPGLEFDTGSCDRSTGCLAAHDCNGWRFHRTNPLCMAGCRHNHAAQRRRKRHSDMSRRACRIARRRKAFRRGDQSKCHRLRHCQDPDNVRQRFERHLSVAVPRSAVLKENSVHDGCGPGEAGSASQFMPVRFEPESGF